MIYFSKININITKYLEIVFRYFTSALLAA